MRLAARVDLVQPVIVAALRKVGAAVIHLHQLGGGVPDLLVWHRNKLFLLELKNPGEGPNKEQTEFIAKWPGEIYIVHSTQEALTAVLGAKAMA